MFVTGWRRSCHAPGNHGATAAFTMTWSITCLEVRTSKSSALRWRRSTVHVMMSNSRSTKRCDCPSDRTLGAQVVKGQWQAWESTGSKKKSTMNTIKFLRLHLCRASRWSAVLDVNPRSENASETDFLNKFTRRTPKKDAAEHTIKFLSCTFGCVHLGRAQVFPCRKF